MDEPMKKNNSKGFSLIELLLALAIMGIVTTAIYQLYISQFKTWVSQDLVTELQQSGRLAIDTITREMQLMGYGLPAGQVAIKDATATQFTFRSRDEAITSGEQKRQISFRLNGTKLEMGVSEWDGSAFPDITNWDVLAENVDNQPGPPVVPGLNFKYYNDQGNTAASIDDIRRIQVTVRLKTSKKDPITYQYKSLTLITEVRPRNLGIGEVQSDVKPPAIPTGLRAIDPGKCGTLQLRWSNNTEVDLNGYVIYYSLASRSDAVNFTGYRKVRVDTSAADGYELTGLTTTASTSATPSMYYVAVTAYDANGNESDYSAEISGNPSPSVRAFGGANDTTVNMEKPAPPTNFKGRDAGANQVELRWTPSIDPQVIGYRIYRSTSPFTTFPIPEGMRIADESVLTSGRDSYTDTSGGLIGCTVYYYAIAPITCDGTLITDDPGDDDTKRYVEADYAVTYGDGTGPLDDSPSDSDTSPKDGVPPGTPMINKTGGTIVSGFKRTYMSFVNPNDTDFDHTVIYYSTTATPSVDTTPSSPTYGVISGGVPVPDTTNVAKGIKGWFGGFGATVSFVHDSETGDTIEDISAEHEGRLTEQRYYYLAVAYDKCGNPAADTAQATTLAELCGDGAEGDPEHGSPDAPTNPNVTGCSTNMRVSWNAVTSNAYVNPDAAFYRVYRSPTATFPTSKEPRDLDKKPCDTSPNEACYLGFVPIGSATAFNDGTLYGLADGNTYSYGIVTTDCVYENRWIANNESEFQDNNSMHKQGWLVFNGVGSNGVTPGRIKREDQHKEVLTRDSSGDKTKDAVKAVDPTVVTSAGDVPTKGYHNTVKLYFRNTSQGKMTINSISNISWNDVNARLAKISIGSEGGSEYTTCSIIYNTVPTPPAVWVTPTTPGPIGPTSIVLTGGVQISGSCLNVPITLEFQDSSGNVNENVDMRGKDVRMTLDVKNDSTNTTTCSSYLTVTELNEPFTVDKGPSFDTNGDGTDNVELSSPSLPATSPIIVPSSGGIPDASFIKIANDDPITVSAKIMAQDIDKNVCSNSMNLYYNVTDRGVANTTPPTSFPNKIAMTDKGGGQFEAFIDKKRNKRVWFYAVGQDDHSDCGTSTDRNFDRTPEVGIGYYAYDQTEDPCGSTPNPPFNLTLTNTSPSSHDVDSSGKVGLSWTAPTQNTDNTEILDLSGFKVYATTSTDKGLTWSSPTLPAAATVSGSVIGQSYSASVDASGYSSGTWLRYCVSAIDKCTPTAKESLPLDSSCVSPVVKGTCSANPTIASLVVSNGGSYSNNYDRDDGSVGLSWNANNDGDFDAYNIYASTDGGASWGLSLATITDASATTYPATTIANENTSVKYKIVTKDKCNKTTDSNIVTITKSCSQAPPSAPTVTNLYGNIAKTNNPNAGEVSLSWSGSTPSDFSGYNVYVTGNGGQTWTKLTSTPQTTTTYAYTPANGTYTYGVTIVDKCGKEGPKGTVTVYKNPVSTGTPISTSLGTTWTSAHRPWPAYASYYTVTIGPNATISLSGTGSMDDTYMYLLNSAGSIVAYDDDSGSSYTGALDSRIVISGGQVTTPSYLLGTSVPAGTYIIEVTTYGSNVTGNYTLSVTNP